MEKVHIIEYQEKYNTEVRHLLYTTLRYVGLPKDCMTPKRDADLDNIGEIYQGRGRFWLAIEGEKLIGMTAILEDNHETAKLRRMFVLPSYHGTGLGQLLLSTALKFAREQKYVKIILDTHETLGRARRFYEKKGFNKTHQEGRIVHYELYL
ncbi:hypothetical protein A2Y99_04830 [Candidatus Gottesmanbacteria bacterium RBG_13_37_7]|uniref:N-acetyltransferase domain-containing protein n=1 Tax=Candidatus Gottesmanbacteria bacterium RBG_13_37_7 TaxID=1798369 RepID=A0A1F5YJU0_9BACT|nr:MAG: hypothetical protein A2Y99_04830 [Candidatus Gottesmanbacteria bacterium RBG_13_37_7]